MVVNRETNKGLKIKIATPAALIDTVDEVDQCIVPTELGEIGILADHVKLVAALGTGILRYEKAGKVSFFVVSGGLVEVQNNVVSVLADVGESGMNIDVRRARESLERARQRVGGGASGVTVDVARALLAEKRALARLAAAEAHHGGSGAGRAPHSS